MCCKYLDMKMLQVNLQHDCVFQVVVHVVDWVLHTWSLVPHTPNCVVVVAEKPCLLRLLTLIIMLLQILLLLMLNTASYESSSCSWRFRCCCCWPWISALSSWRWKCCRCSCRTKPPASHTMPLKLLLMLNLAPHLIPLLQMLLLLVLNVASYLPHHIVAVAVVVLASNIS